jgi:hypothetical protein
VCVSRLRFEWNRERERRQRELSKEGMSESGASRLVNEGIDTGMEWNEIICGSRLEFATLAPPLSDVISMFKIKSSSF